MTCVCDRPHQAGLQGTGTETMPLRLITLPFWEIALSIWPFGKWTPDLGCQVTLWPQLSILNRKLSDSSTHEYRSGFLNLDTTDTLAITFAGGKLSWAVYMFSSIPGLYQLVASSTTQLWQSEMSLNITKYLAILFNFVHGGQNCP